MPAANNTRLIQEDITTATGKITGFISDKVDDAKYHMEARKRKFEISGESSGIDRTKDDVTRWFYEGYKNLAANLVLEKDGEKKRKKNETEVGDDDPDEPAGCGACVGGCGLFST